AAEWASSGPTAGLSRISSSCAATTRSARDRLRSRIATPRSPQTKRARSSLAGHRQSSSEAQAGPRALDYRRGRTGEASSATTRRPARNEARETGRTAAGRETGRCVSRTNRRLTLLLLLSVLLAPLNPDTTHAAGRSAAGGAPVGRNFYVSAEGNDANPGTSTTAPWRTLAKVESASLRPGDHVHLQGGTRFAEPLAPFAGVAGASGAPITFDSYGNGRATLAAGIYLNSVSNLTFADFNLTSTRKGIFSSAGGTGARAITLRDITVSDVPLAGISSNNRS